MNRKQLSLFIIMFLVLLAGRLCIATTGYLDDQDETYYIWIHKHFDEFRHFQGFWDCISRNRAHPPEIIIRLLEYITLLPLASMLNKQMLHPDVLYFIGLYNIISSLLILYVFYRIALKLKYSFALSLVGTFLLGTLLNFNLYIRHILPYDHSLLFHLLAISLLLNDRVSQRRVFVAGLLSAIGLTCYLGSFMFVFVVLGYLILSRYETPKTAAKSILHFILPFLIVIFCYEVYGRFAGRPYLDILLRYSDTVGGEGSYDEGLTYVFLYFYLVEKWWGIILLLFFFAGSYYVFIKGSNQLKQLLGMGIIAYLIYGTYVVVCQKMVFEGRVLHIYYPLIIIGVLGFIQLQKIFKPNYIAITFALFALINYCFIIEDLNSIGYPRNAIYKYHLFAREDKVSFTYCSDIKEEYVVSYSNRSSVRIDSIGADLLPSGHYLLQNICFLPHYPDSVFAAYDPCQINQGDSIVFEQTDFQSHPAYLMEYCSRNGRNFYLNHRIMIRVIRQRPQ